MSDVYEGLFDYHLLNYPIQITVNANSMKLLISRWALVLFALLPLNYAWTQSIRELTLTDVLTAALERSPNDIEGNLEQGFRSSSWLAALPSVSVNYLDSNDALGTDETEISINLPIKSSRQRRVDKQLKELGSEYNIASKQYKSLLLSGLIREAIWSYEIAQVRLNSISHKYQLLSQLEGQYRDLFRANVVSEFSLMRIQQELLQAQLEQLTQEQELTQWLQQYRTVTGLSSMPLDITEPQLGSHDFVLGQHPQLRLLTLGWLQKQLVLLASSNQSAPWNMSLSVKNIESAGFEEDQYGIGIEVPLSFLRIATETHNSEWLKESQTFDIAKDEALINLQRSWETLSLESKILQRKNLLLSQSKALNERISEQANELKAYNELGEEIILRQMIDAIDSQAAITINETLIHQNNAMLRQAAGISL